MGINRRMLCSDGTNDADINGRNYFWSALQMIYLYALVAIAISDPIANHPLQTISYHSIISECQKEKNRIEPTINTSYIKLDCVPLRAE